MPAEPKVTSIKLATFPDLLHLRPNFPSLSQHPPEAQQSVLSGHRPVPVSNVQFVLGQKRPFHEWFNVIVLFELFPSTSPNLNPPSARTGSWGWSGVVPTHMGSLHSLMKWSWRVKAAEVRVETNDRVIRRESVPIIDDEDWNTMIWMQMPVMMWM